ncbi:crk-like protein [Platysternon megacephalum]|uniref:Crk-like protein n=1 Tax=Platysternon megacephalum TaxID=55544 RepID=A0A4D9DKK5_9SAUR|nr:crk-like protein [Platysternon megacephalum]
MGGVEQEAPDSPRGSSICSPTSQAEWPLPLGQRQLPASHHLLSSQDLQLHNGAGVLRLPQDTPDLAAEQLLARCPGTGCQQPRPQGSAAGATCSPCQGHCSTPCKQGSICSWLLLPGQHVQEKLRHNQTP